MSSALGESATTRLAATAATRSDTTAGRTWRVRFMCCFDFDCSCSSQQKPEQRDLADALVRWLQVLFDVAVEQRRALGPVATCLKYIEDVIAAARAEDGRGR